MEMGGSSSKFEITTIDSSDQEIIYNYGSDLGYNTLINWCGDTKQACNSIVDQQPNSCKNAGGAFATIAAIESQWKIQNDSLFKLSEQECLDCAYTTNEGCATASFPNDCISFGKSVRAISLNSIYPLTDVN